jgi:hypothetical protein
MTYLFKPEVCFSLAFILLKYNQSRRAYKTPLVKDAGAGFPACSITAGRAPKNLKDIYGQIDLNLEVCISNSMCTGQ